MKGGLDGEKKGGVSVSMMISFNVHVLISGPVADELGVGSLEGLKSPRNWPVMMSIVIYQGLLVPGDARKDGISKCQTVFYALPALALVAG